LGVGMLPVVPTLPPAPVLALLAVPVVNVAPVEAAAVSEAALEPPAVVETAPTMVPVEPALVAVPPTPVVPLALTFAPGPAPVVEVVSAFALLLVGLPGEESLGGALQLAASAQLAPKPTARADRLLARMHQASGAGSAPARCPIRHPRPRSAVLLRDTAKMRSLPNRQGCKNRRLVRKPRLRHAMDWPRAMSHGQAASTP